MGGQGRGRDEEAGAVEEVVGLGFLGRALVPEVGVEVGGEELVAAGGEDGDAEETGVDGTGRKEVQEEVDVLFGEGDLAGLLGVDEEGVGADGTGGVGGGEVGVGGVEVVEDGGEEGGFGFVGVLAGEEERVGGAGGGGAPEVGEEAGGEGEEGGTVEGDAGFGEEEAGPDGVGVELDGGGGEFGAEPLGSVGEAAGGDGGDRGEGVVRVLAVVVEDGANGGEAVEVLLVVDVGAENVADVLEGAFGSDFGLEVVDVGEVEEGVATGEDVAEVRAEGAVHAQVEAEVHAAERVGVVEPGEEDVAVVPGTEIKRDRLGRTELAQRPGVPPRSRGSKG